MIKQYLSDKNPRKKRLFSLGRFEIWECLQRVKPDGKATTCYVIATPDKIGIIVSASELEALARFTIGGIECGLIRESSDLSEWENEKETCYKNRLWGV